MTTLSTVVVGTVFRGPEALEAVAKMRPGDALALVREPNNRFDQRAVACHYLGVHVGFIPMKLNAGVSKALDEEVAVEAVVTEGATIAKGRLTEPKILLRWSE